METEKVFTVISTINYKGKKYYRLMADDFDTFFMGDNNGELDYITYEEYVELEKIYKYNGALHSNNQLYKVTYTNVKTKNESFINKIKTRKLVWFLKSKIPLAIAGIFAAGIITASGIAIDNLVKNITFDDRFTHEDYKDYGVETKNVFNITEIDGGITQQYIADYIVSVDSSKFPSYSHVINKEVFNYDYELLSMDNYCKDLNIGSVTYNDIYNSIQIITGARDEIKELLTEAVQRIEQVYPNYDLRVLKDNLDSLHIKQSSSTIAEDLVQDIKNPEDIITIDTSFNPFSDELLINIFTVDTNNYSLEEKIKNNKEIIIKKLIHELGHMFKNAYDVNTKKRTTSYVDFTFEDGYIGGKQTDVGISYEEFKDEKFTQKVTNEKNDFDINSPQFAKDLFYTGICEMLGIEEVDDVSYMGLLANVQKNLGMEYEFLKNTILIDEAYKDKYRSNNIQTMNNINSIRAYFKDSFSELLFNDIPKSTIYEIIDKIFINLEKLYDINDSNREEFDTLKENMKQFANNYNEISEPSNEELGISK